MLFDIQHNGKYSAKGHLLDEQSGVPLCGTTSMLNFTSMIKIRIKDGRKFEAKKSPSGMEYDTEICDVLARAYCKTCMKIGTKISENVKQPRQ